MPIDSNIALGVNPVQIESPMSSLMKAMQVKDAMQSSQMNAAKMDEYARTKDRQSKLWSTASFAP